MRRCAFLTTDLTGMVNDDELACEPLRRLGWSVELVDWRVPRSDWKRYDLVVIRSTWDYHRDPELFLETLAAIDRSGVRLENPLEIVRWNYRKTYLLDLAARGVPIVPTLIREAPRRDDLAHASEELRSHAIVVKPVIGANADETYRIDDLGDVDDALVRRLAERVVMVQPLVPSVLDEGEYSVFYFHGSYSHAILKTPKRGDFRVQEEHGGTIRAVDAEPSLAKAAVRCVAALERVPLYARVDVARAAVGDEWWLMELELIEPSLYLRMDAEAPERFARAIDRIS